MKSSFSGILQPVSRYYTEKIESFGPTPGGVDWNSEASQELRFRQLVKICDGIDMEEETFSLTDIGCGYGALYEFMRREMGSRGIDFHYFGCDISPKMVEAARQSYGDCGNCSFHEGEDFGESDYTVASGIFNVKLDTPPEEWKTYILATIQAMDRTSRKGFAFNMLTTYSDTPRMQDYLYYGDPCFFFHHCKSRFSRDVALLHDYGLYEFTLLVRKK